MIESISELKYIQKIKENANDINAKELESLYYDIVTSRVIVPTGEGRSKGALSIACSEIAKMDRGKIILDRSDIGFPGRDLYEAAPIIREKYGPLTLLVNSGSGKALIPLIDAQKLGQYIAETENKKEFKIDVVTSDPESPLGRLGSKFGTTMIVKGKREEERPENTTEFREYGILGDIYELSTAAIFQAIAEALNKDSPFDKVFINLEQIFDEIFYMFKDKNVVSFLNKVSDELERRSICVFGGLGSGLEVARMTAVRLGHIKRAMGDVVYVIRDTNLPVPRKDDVFIVVSYSGETEVVVSWCKNFKKMGGKVISIVGNKNSTIASISDEFFHIESNYKKGEPNRFYLKAAFLLSPLPIFLAERFAQRGFRMPEYVLRWYQSVISII